MKRTLSAMEARQKLGEVIEGVYYRGDEVKIERAGKTMAVVVPLQLYEAFLKQREELFELIERNWEKNQEVSESEIEAEIQEALNAVRVTKKRKATA